MNEQLQNALAEILGKTLNGIDAASSFVVAELPDVIQQLLVWYAVKSFIFTIVGVLMWSLPFISYRKLNEWHKKDKVLDKDLFIDVGFPVALIFSAVFCMSWFLFDLDWLQIILTPKIWLIEYASELVK